MSYLRWYRRRLDVPSWLNSQDFNVVAANFCRNDLDLTGYFRAVRARKLNHVSFENALMLEKQYNIPVTLKPSSSVDNITYLTPSEISDYTSGLRRGAFASGLKLDDRNFERWSYHGAYQEFSLATNKVDEFDPTRQSVSENRVTVKGANLITSEVDSLGNGSFAFHDYNLYKARLNELFTSTTDGNVYVVDGSLGYDFNVRAICDDIYTALFYKYLFKAPTPALPRERVVDATIWGCSKYSLPSPKIRYMLNGPTSEDLKFRSSKLAVTTAQHFFHSTSPITSFSLMSEFIADSFNTNPWVISGQQPLICIKGDLFRRASGQYTLLLNGGNPDEKVGELRRSSQLVGAHFVTIDAGHVSPVFDGVVSSNESEKEFDVVFEGSNPGIARKISQVSGVPDRGYSKKSPRLTSGLPSYSPNNGDPKPLRIPLGNVEVVILGENSLEKVLGEGQHYSRRISEFSQAAANVQTLWKQHESHHGSAELSFRKIHLDNERKKNEDLAQHILATGLKIFAENGISPKTVKGIEGIGKYIQ